MAMALQPSPKTLSPRPQASGRPTTRANQPSRYLHLAAVNAGRRSAPCLIQPPGQVPVAREDVRQDDPGGVRGVPTELVELRRGAVRGVPTELLELRRGAVRGVPTELLELRRAA